MFSPNYLIPSYLASKQVNDFSILCYLNSQTRECRNERHILKIFLAFHSFSPNFLLPNKPLTPSLILINFIGSQLGATFSQTESEATLSLTKFEAKINI